jgi:hypothetical protein
MRILRPVRARAERKRTSIRDQRGVPFPRMERILLAELRLLAEVFGPESVAGVAYELASALDAPMVVRHGKKLIVVEMAVEDTIVIRRFW